MKSDFKGIKRDFQKMEEKQGFEPTDKEKWNYSVSQAKEKFKTYPSAVANLWASKKYKSLGGKWKKEETVKTIGKHLKENGCLYNAENVKKVVKEYSAYFTENFSEIINESKNTRLFIIENKSSYEPIDEFIEENLRDWIKKNKDTLKQKSDQIKKTDE